MKLLTLLYYACRSILLRGPFQTLAIALNEKKGDERLGVSTRSFKYESSSVFNHYQGASYLVLGKIFDALEQMTPLKRLTDIGSGMGRVLFYAEERKFTHLLGIERDAELVAAARDNTVHQPSSLKRIEMDLVQADALSVDYAKEARIYFLFNPFGAEIIKGVLQKIKATLQEDCIFVYMNPVHAQEFDLAGCTELMRLKTNFYTEAIFYKMSAKTAT